MEFELPKRWQKHLQGLPESAMGSQHVDIVLNTGEVIENVTVYNGRFAQLSHALNSEQSIVNIVMNDQKK
jgi:hypothetical protein